MTRNLCANLLSGKKLRGHNQSFKSIDCFPFYANFEFTMYKYITTERTTIYKKKNYKRQIFQNELVAILAEENI